MLNEFNINPEVLKIYRDYTYERANIYYLKEILGLPEPWTNDPFLISYKFTNVNRELDRQSKFLISTVINNKDLSKENIALNCALFRCINHEESTRWLKQWPVDFDNFNKQEFYEFELSLGNDPGWRLQSNAYFLSHIRRAANNIDKSLAGSNVSIVNFINENKKYIIDAYFSPTIEQCMENLYKIPNFGDFMVYQIWVDFTYSENYQFNEDQFVISGPGCSNGIDWIIEGNNLINKLDPERIDYGALIRNYKDKTYEDFLYWFRNNLSTLMKENSLDWEPEKFLHFLPIEKRKWTLMAVENSFCELNKLMKLKNKIPMRHRYYGS